MVSLLELLVSLIFVFPFQFVAGFGRGGTSIPFWENVYGFNMSCIGKELVEDAARVPIVDVVDSCDIVTNTAILQVSAQGHLFIFVISTKWLYDYYSFTCSS